MWLVGIKKQRKLERLKTRYMLSHLKYFGFVLLSWGLLSSCGDSPKPMPILEEELSADAPSEVFDSIYMLFTEEARTRMKLFAIRLHRYDEKFGHKNVTEMLDSLNFYVYDEKGNVDAILTAGYGVIFDDEERIEFKQHVVYKNLYQKHRLDTEYLIWNQKTKKIHVPDSVKVRVTEERNIINGMGMDADEDFARYKIRKVSGIIAVKNQEE